MFLFPERLVMMMMMMMMMMRRRRRRRRVFVTLNIFSVINLER